MSLLLCACSFDNYDMSIGTIDGAQLGAKKGPLCDSERRARNHSAVGSGALSQTSGRQATSSDCSHTDCSKGVQKCARNWPTFLSTSLKSTFVGAPELSSI